MSTSIAAAPRESSISRQLDNRGHATLLPFFGTRIKTRLRPPPRPAGVLLGGLTLI
jgi:hypothetical protein